MRKIKEDALFELFRHGTEQNDDNLWEPHTDIYETSSKLFIRLALAGIEQQDITLSFSEDLRNIIIKGKRKENYQIKPIRYYRLEIYYGSFEKRIAIPEDIHIDAGSPKADLKNGILTIEIDKNQQIKKNISIEGTNIL